MNSTIASCTTTIASHIEIEDNVQTWLAADSGFAAGLLRLSIKDSKSFPGSMFEKKVVETISPSEWWSIVSKRNKRMTDGKLSEGFAVPG